MQSIFLFSGLSSCNEAPTGSKTGCATNHAKDNPLEGTVCAIESSNRILVIKKNLL